MAERHNRFFVAVASFSLCTGKPPNLDSTCCNSIVVLLWKYCQKPTDTWTCGELRFYFIPAVADDTEGREGMSQLFLDSLKSRSCKGSFDMWVWVDMWIFGQPETLRGWGWMKSVHTPYLGIEQRIHRIFKKQCRASGYKNVLRLIGASHEVET
jgi:hypothetical protein